MLISAPFTQCPQCNQNTFGILSIRKNYYEKRCKNCLYPNNKEELSYLIPLPELNKKIIYLDQMAISNMMKSLNPNTKAFNKVEKVWLELFETLDKLCKMQMIICPSSDFHQEESLLSSYYESIKCMYDLLSFGIKFKNEFSLKVNQALLSLELFLDNKPFDPLKLNTDLAFNNDINIWQDRFYLTLKFDITDAQIEIARKQRDNTSEEFNVIFKTWQLSKKSFQEFFEVEEKASFQIINDYLDFLKKDRSEHDIIDYSISPDWILLNTIRSRIAKKISDPIQVLHSIVDYFISENYRSIPCLRISSYLFAGLARKASQGQKRPPSKGMLNDISIIANYLPFCDAMFLDNECLSLLNDNPTGEYIKHFRAKLFSKNSISALFDYLKEIEESATQAHINKLKEVYGDNWCKPYTELYKNN